MIKQRIMWTEILEVVIFVARGRTTRVIITQSFAFLSGRTKKVMSRKLKYNFTKKAALQLLGHIGLQILK